MSDQEAKEIKAEAREIMPQPSTVNCSLSHWKAKVHCLMVLPVAKASDNAGQAKYKTEPVKDYILLPLWTADPPYSQDLKSSHDD
ncbi:hypothetical protein Tco_1262455 [Tanacetum coccineum]